MFIQETVGSIKKLFTALWGTPDDEIRLCVRLDELDDTFLIAEDMWSELLPGLKHVKVALDQLSPGGMILDRSLPRGMIVDQPLPGGMVVDQPSPTMIPDSLLNEKIQSEQATLRTQAIYN